MLNNAFNSKKKDNPVENKDKESPASIGNNEDPTITKKRKKEDSETKGGNYSSILNRLNSPKNKKKKLSSSPSEVKVIDNANFYSDLFCDETLENLNFSDNKLIAYDDVLSKTPPPKKQNKPELLLSPKTPRNKKALDVSVNSESFLVECEINEEKFEVRISSDRRKKNGAGGDHKTPYRIFVEYVKSAIAGQDINQAMELLVKLAEGVFSSKELKPITELFQQYKNKLTTNPCYTYEGRKEQSALYRNLKSLINIGQDLINQGVLNKKNFKDEKLQEKADSIAKKLNSVPLDDMLAVIHKTTVKNIKTMLKVASADITNNFLKKMITQIIITLNNMEHATHPRLTDFDTKEGARVYKTVKTLSSANLFFHIVQNKLAKDDTEVKEFLNIKKSSSEDFYINGLYNLLKIPDTALNKLLLDCKDQFNHRIRSNKSDESKIHSTKSKKNIKKLLREIINEEKSGEKKSELLKLIVSNGIIAELANDISKLYDFPYDKNSLIINPREVLYKTCARHFDLMLFSFGRLFYSPQIKPYINEILKKFLQLVLEDKQWNKYKYTKEIGGKKFMAPLNLDDLYNGVTDYFKEDLSKVLKESEKFISQEEKVSGDEKNDISQQKIFKL